MGEVGARGPGHGAVGRRRSALLTLLSIPSEDRDLDLADAMYEAVLRLILTDVPTLPADSATAVTVAFGAIAPKLPMLTDSEHALLSGWLDRAEGRELARWR